MMHRRYPVRLLLREHGICGGTETVNIHLVHQFIELVDLVVWVVPASRTEYFQRILPPSDRLVYQLPYWPQEARLAKLLRKAASFGSRRKTPLLRLPSQRFHRELHDLWLRHLVRQYGITHCFFNWTFCVDVPRVSVPIGAMLMDVRWKQFPETFPKVDVNVADQQFCNWLKKSTVVFPISEATASDIRQFYPWHSVMTRIVPHGADSSRQPERERPTTELDRKPRPFFFCPASASGHKNHITLFRACAALFSRGFDFDVVLTGFATNQFQRNGQNGHCPPLLDPGIELARRYLDQHEHLFQGRIKPLGYIDRNIINDLYAKSVGVILPSLFEGFGLALVEALQNGASVICSDIPAHREQLRRYDCADAVTLVQPHDYALLAAEMEQILTASNEGAVKTRQPPTSLDRWTWRDVARTYVESLTAVTAKDNSADFVVGQELRSS